MEISLKTHLTINADTKYNLKGAFDIHLVTSSSVVALSTGQVPLNLFRA